MSLHIGKLAKHIPAVSEMRLGTDGRFQRARLATEVDAYSRRAVAKAAELAALVRMEGPFNLILAGRCSLDADTGQVGPQVAELLDALEAHRANR